MGKIVMSLAISLDGYILDEQGNYDWIVGDGSDALDSVSEARFSFDAFLASVDTVVMGRRSYDLHGQDFQEHQVWVATHRGLPEETSSHVTPLRGDIVSAVLALRDARASTGNQQSVDKDIWLFGGAELIAPFVAQGAIDRYIIGIIPVLLGSGKPLFTPGFSRQQLTLKQMSAEGGIVVLQYEPRGGQ